MSSNIYTLYKADYNPNPNYLEVDPLNVNFDQGNEVMYGTEPITANGKYQRVVHKSLDHLYYRDFYTNNKAAFGSGNIAKQYRLIEDQAYVISLPQSRFGEMIMTDSVSIKMNYSLIPSSGSYSGSVVSSQWSVVDDSYGNLLITGSGLYSVYGQYITSSVTKTPVAEWPFDNVYKYVNSSNITLTSSFNRGLWLQESNYNNLIPTYLSGSNQAGMEELDFLGAALHFTSSLSSSIEYNLEEEYAKRFNFENGSYAISMMVLPKEVPTHKSGSVLLTKAGPVEELRVDANGNIWSQPIPNKTPYALIYTSGSHKVSFQRSAGDSLFEVTSSVSMSVDTLYHVVASVSASQVSLHVRSALTSSLDTGTFNLPDKYSSNLSNLFIGNTYTLDRGFNGVLDNVKMYNTSLSEGEINTLHHTLGVGNTFMGNVFYNHGMIVLGAIPAKFAEVASVEARGSHTIWETEVSCTINPGEFNMSCNPSLQEYSARDNEYVYRSFVTGSHFKPYITTIGLYDDYGRLVVVGKVNTPIQTPKNVDTTIVLKFDR